MSGAPSLSSKSGSEGLHADWILLTLFTLVWRAPWILTPEAQPDELLWSLPTVHRILSGHAPVFALGTTYGGTINEHLAAALFRLWGEESLVLLRIPGLLFGALSVPLGYLTVREVASRPVAQGVGVMLACPNSAVLYHAVFAIPAWSTSMALTGLLALLLVRAAKRGLDPGGLAAVSLLGGFATYVLQISVLQSISWVLWTAFLGNLRRASRVWSGVRQPTPSRVAGMLLVTTAGAAGAAVSYHWLTRPAVFAFGPAHGVGLSWALLAGTIGIWLCAKGIVHRPARRDLASLLVCSAAFAGGLLPLQLCFRWVERPILLLELGDALKGTGYSWRHASEWPTQAFLLADRAIPTLLVGRLDEAAELGPASPGRLMLTVGFLFSTWFVLLRPDRDLFRPGHRYVWMLLLPVVLVAVALTPSWKLFGAWSFRYFLPVLPGMYLAIVHLLFALPISREIRISLAGAYCSLCAVDSLALSRL